MNDSDRSVFYLGVNDAVCSQLGEALRTECQREIPQTKGDVPALVFIEAAGDPAVLADLPGRNPFAACRDLKSRLGVQVFVLVDADDQVSPEIARFCLADGSLRIGTDGRVEDLEMLTDRIAPHRSKVSVDALLEKLEREIASDEGRQASAIQRMLAQGESSGLLDKIVDPETGLFDGPYASFKLDEEFKRARRFHQPLSLLLLDVGVDLSTAFEDPNDRQTFLAEVSSVFLNECRDIDVLARFTESTFMIMMPGTGRAGAEVVAARMFAEFAEKGIYGGISGQPFHGLAVAPSSGISDRRAFLARAEARLQMAGEAAAS